jgi:hypothetical protein
VRNIAICNDFAFDMYRLAILIIIASLFFGIERLKIMISVGKEMENGAGGRRGI